MMKLFKSFLFAFRGLGYTFKTQLNFKIHCIAAIVAIVLGVCLEITAGEWFWLGLCIAIVLILELINTAIEVLVDLVSPAYHIKAGAVKDVAAAAVLVAAIFAMVVAGFIFYPKIVG